MSAGDRVTTQFWSPTKDGPPTEVAIWPADDPLGPINGDSFAVGEPVYLNRGAWGARGAGVPAPRGTLDRIIFYITRFYTSDDGHHKCTVGTKRGYGGLHAPVSSLRKLDPLTRLAAEAVD